MLLFYHIALNKEGDIMLHSLICGKETTLQQALTILQNSNAKEILRILYDDRGYTIITYS